MAGERLQSKMKSFGTSSKHLQSIELLDRFETLVVLIVKSAVDFASVAIN